MSKYTHLSMRDRQRFCTFLQMKLPISEIAKRMVKHRATLYRELKRNVDPEGYYLRIAQLKTLERAKQKGQVNCKPMVFCVIMLSEV